MAAAKLSLAVYLAVHGAWLYGAGSVHARMRHLASNKPMAEPDYSVYHTKASLLEEVESLVQANPDTMALEIVTDQDKDYNITMRVVNVEVGGLSDDVSRKARILIDFGEHAREYVSSELGLSFLRMLSDPKAIAELVGGGERGRRLLQLLQQTAFKILPMENERGRDLVEHGKLCERKNGRGVDPNRNWEVDWGRKEKDYDPNEEYPGARPFSEPEVRTVLRMAQSFQPHVWINIHSGMEAMFTPWDHKGEVPEGAQEALALLQTIKDNLFTSQCVVGSGGKSVGYLAHGTATDYMFERLKVPLSYTWEIYGDMQAPFHDCFRMFNPLTKDHLERLINQWLKALFRLIELLPTHSAFIKGGVFSSDTQAGSKQAVTEGAKDGQVAPVDTEPAAAASPGSTPGKLDEQDDGPASQTDDGGAKRTVDGSFVLVAPLHVLQHSTGGLQLLLAVSCVALVGIAAVSCSPYMASKVASCMHWRQKRQSLLPVTTALMTAGPASVRP